MGGAGTRARGPGVEYPARSHGVVGGSRCTGQKVAGHIEDQVGRGPGRRAAVDRRERAVGGQADRDVVGPRITPREAQSGGGTEAEAAGPRSITPAAVSPPRSGRRHRHGVGRRPEPFLRRVPRSGHAEALDRAGLEDSREADVGGVAALTLARGPGCGAGSWREAGGGPGYGYAAPGPEIAALAVLVEVTLWLRRS